MPVPFTFKKIDSPQLLEEVFRLRYQVYCTERNFISEAECPEGYETDDHDPHAVHFGAFDLQETLVGAVRLILPSCEKFPVEERCSALKIDWQSVVRQEYAEISRLAISKLYRKSTAQELSLGPQPDEKPSVYIRRISLITLGLCCLMYQECRLYGINYCFALMEEPLSLLLKLHGFSLSPLGPEVDYYGKVTPHLIDVLENERRGLFRMKESLSHGREIHLQKDCFS